MFRRTLLLSCVFFSLCLQGFSQKSKTFFAHSAGISAFVGNENYGKGGLSYAPRINFLCLSNDATFSIGSHLAAGGSFGEHGYNSKDTGIQIGGNNAYDLPVLLAYNFGNGATRIATKRLGGYVGMGYGWHTHRQSYFERDRGHFQVNSTIGGPMMEAGFRFAPGRASFGLHVSHMMNVNGSNPRGLTGMTVISFQYNLATWMPRKVPKAIPRGSFPGRPIKKNPSRSKKEKDFYNMDHYQK